MVTILNRLLINLFKLFDCDIILIWNLYQSIFVAISLTESIVIKFWSVSNWRIFSTHSTSRISVPKFDISKLHIRGIEKYHSSVQDLIIWKSKDYFYYLYWLKVSNQAWYHSEDTTIRAIYHSTCWWRLREHTSIERTSIKDINSNLSFKLKSAAWD